MIAPARPLPSGAWDTLAHVFGPYDLFPLAPDYPDVRPYHDALVSKRSDRLLWGSDWPYIGLAIKPRVEQLVDLFDEWVLDESLRQQILVTNPAALFEPA